MKTHINNFFDALLTKYLPLLAIFTTGAATILMPLTLVQTMSVYVFAQPFFLISEVICVFLYFALLHLYSRSIDKDIKHMFIVTLIGSLIFAAFFFLFQTSGGHPMFLLAGIGAAFIYIWLLHHKKWV